MATDPVPDALLSKLQSERVGLMQTLASLDQASQPVELDQSAQGRLSRMDAIGQQHMAKAGQANLRARLLQIDAALRRIDAGEYGLCRECETPIAPARLRADPAAPLCLNCAALAEQSR